MIKLLALADSHWGLSSRASECSRLHIWALEQAHEIRPDAVLLAGDLYHGPASPELREEVSAWVQGVAEEAPVLVLRGNHDRPNEVAHTRRLRARHPIIAVESPEVHAVAGVAVAALPWPNGGNLLAGLNGAAKSEAREAGVSAMQDILRGLDMELDEYPGLPRVLLAHCTISGARTGTGMQLIGMDFELGLADLAMVHADAVVLGHVHQRQSFDLGVPCAYVGTSYATDWGDPGPHGIALLECEPGQPARVTWIDSPAEQLITLDDEWCTEVQDFQGGSAWLQAPNGERKSCDNHSFKFRYSVPAEHAGAAAAKAAEVREWFLAAGAKSVKVEPEILVSNHARVPEVATGKTIADQLQAYWQSQPDEYPPEVRERLLGCLAELEAP